MGRPEKICGVSPTTASLLMLLIWQGHVLASTIFPLNSVSKIGFPQDSFSSWDFDDDDTEISNGEYANFFSEDNRLSSEDMNDATKTSPTNNDRKEADQSSNSFDGDSSSLRSVPGKSSNNKNEWSPGIEPTEGITLPQSQFHATYGKYFHRTRPLALATLAKETHVGNKIHDTASTSVTQLGVQHGRFFGKRKSETTALPSYPFFGSAPLVPSHATHNNGHYSSSIDDVSRNDVEGVQAETRRFVYSTNNMKKEKATDSNRRPTTMDPYSVNTTTTVSISEAAKNQSGHGTNVSGQRNNSSLQFKFPDRIPFPYVRRGNDEDIYKRAPIKPQNMNEGRRSTDPRQRYYYSVNGEARLQRRNRSRRDTLQTLFEDAKRLAEEEIETTRRMEEDHGETHKHFEGNQQHKSSERSVVGNNGVRNDGVTETNVRDNTTSRPPPPPPSNPVEVLQRLTRLLDRMLRELSVFGRKFTLRLIRMTERQDIDQMQEIMKDFDISPQKPIFFIAGGLKKLNENELTRVVPSSPIAATPNLTENIMAIVLNETDVEETTTEIPTLNSTEDEEQAVPDVAVGSTMVPILRPNGISSLPVESDDSEETTVATAEQEPELDIPDAVDGDSNTQVDSINVTTILNSSPQQPPLTRRKRSVPDIDEFIFLPIPGRSARTENPYDDEEEFYQAYNYPEPSENAEGVVNVEDLDYPYAKHLTSVVKVHEDNPSSNIPSLNNNPGVIDQSQSKKNDEISLNDSNAIIGHVSSSASGETTSALLTQKTVASTPSPVVSVASSLVTLNGSTNANPVPPSDSIKIKEKVLENAGSNDHRQGEQNIHRIQTNNAIASTLGENNIRHVEEYPPTEKLLKAEVVTVENVDDDEPNYAIPHVSTDQKSPSLIPYLESNKPISLFVDKNVKADDNTLSSLHEPFTETQRKVALDIGNKLEINKSPSISAPSSPALKSAVGSSQLLFERKEVVNESKVVTPALPNEILLNEERSFHSNFAGGTSKQNIAEKVPPHEVILTKDELVESGNRQLLSSQPSTGQDSGFVVSSFNDGVVSENERNIAIPPTHSSPAVRPLMFADNASLASLLSNSGDVSTVPVLEDSEIPTLSMKIRASSSEKRTAETDLGAPHRVTLISEPQESNHNDPQEEIKAASLLSPQTNALLPESGINIPFGAAPIKEILPTPNNNAEKVSLTSEYVPALQVQQRTISKPTTSINNIELLENISVQADPTRVDSLFESSVAPHVIQTEESNAQVADVKPINPTKVDPLVGKSSVDEEQARNKQETFTLGENQATLVGQQNVVDEDMKKVVADEKGDKIERGKVQVSPNQANLLAPTVLEVSKIIGNNNATFLPAADKASIANVIPIHGADHVVVRGTGTVDLPSTAPVIERGSTDKIGTTVRNTEQVSVQNSKNSDASGTDENGDGSIAVPIVSDNGEVRNPIAISISPALATGKENVDVLQDNIVKQNLSPVLTSQEPSNVGSILLSPEIAVPLTESSGTTVIEDRLNVGSSSEHAASVLPVLHSTSSTNGVNFQDEKLSAKENDGIIPVIVQKVKPTEINILREVHAVNDLSKIVRDVPKVETIKTEVLPTKVSKVDAPVNVPVEIISSNVNAPVSTPQILEIPPVVVEKDQIAEPVKLITADDSSKGESNPIVPALLSTDKTIKVPQDNTKVESPVNPNSDIVTSLDVGAGAKEIVGTEKNVNSDSSDSPSVVLPSPKVVKVNSLTIVRPEAGEVAIKNEDVALLEPLKKPASIILSTPTTQNFVGAVPVVSESDVAPVQTPSLDAVLKETSNAKVQSLLPPILPSEAVVPDLLAAPVLKATSEAVVPNPIVDPILKQTPAAVISDPLVVSVQKQTSEDAVPVSIPDPNLAQKTSGALASEPLVAPAAKPVEVVDSIPLILKGAQELSISSPVLKEVPQVITSIPSVDATSKLVPEVSLPPPPVSQAQPIASPPFLNIDSNIPVQPGNENIIASLPEINPDSAFGVKPIDTQPHFQIPGLRPSIPERPHPDYLGFISQGVDVDSLIFSPPTAPIVINSPPVFSGYSPTAILRKQEQMMKDYFNGLLVRRALPV